MDRYDVGLTGACAAFLYLNLYVRGSIPMLLGGDQVFFWMWGQRLFHQETIYKDFFQFTPPGTDLVYAGAFSIFGPAVWVTNLVVLMVGITLSMVCLRLAKSIMPRAAATLATAVFVVFVYGTTLNGTHHWFSVLAVSTAILVLFHGRSAARLAVAGALLGMATFFTQSRGPVGAFAIALWLLTERYRTTQPWRGYFRDVGLLILPMGGTWLLLSGYYILTLGFHQLWFYQFGYVRKYVASGWDLSSIGLPQGISRANLALVLQTAFAFLALPLVYLACLWKWVRLFRAGSASAPRLGALSLLGAALLAEVAMSPNWLRIFAVSLPGIILLVWLAGQFGRVSRYLHGLLWLGIVVLATLHTEVSRSHNSAFLNLPGGRIATSPRAAEKLAWLAGHTTPGDFMLQADWPGMYLPLSLRNPTFLDVIAGVGANRVENVDRSVQELHAKQVRYIVLSPRMESLDQYPEGFRKEVLERYSRVQIFSDGDEIWQLRK